MYYMLQFETFIKCSNISFLVIVWDTCRKIRCFFFVTQDVFLVPQADPQFPGWWGWGCSCGEEEDHVRGRQRRHPEAGEPHKGVWDSYIFEGTEILIHMWHLTKSYICKNYQCKIKFLCLKILVNIGWIFYPKQSFIPKWSWPYSDPGLWTE